MANHLFLLSLVAALTLPGLILAQNDTTRQPGTSGADVVKAAVHVLREKCVFPNDHLFLRRLAYVLTEDGTDPSTYRPGYDGGIWKVDNDTFHLTLKIVNDDLFEEAFGITWSQVTWDELRKPLYSVIAASLYVISHTPNGQFPVTEDEQAALYHSLFGGSASDFKKNITSLDTGMHLGKQGIYKSTHFNFSVYNSSSSAKNAVLRIPKISGGTSTWLALDEAADTLFSNTSTRPGASRVAVLATDGYSILSMTNASAERLKSKDVSVFAIGVGSGTNLQELNAIASTPKCIHMRELSGFSELASIITDIKEESCKAAAVQKEGSNNTYSCQKETAFSLDVQNGYSVVVRPDSGHVDIYGSFSTSLPSAALSDFSSEAKSNRPVILFIEEKGNERKIYLTVSSSPNKTGDCQSYFELVVYTKNVLSLEVPLVPLCAINGTANACDILTIIKGQLNIGNKTANTTATTSSDTTILPENQTSPFPNTSSPHIKPTAPATPTPSTTHIPCPGSGPGVYAHPVSKTSYVACAEDGSVYVFQCPAGLSFTVKERRCSTPVRYRNVTCTLHDPTVTYPTLGLASDVTPAIFYVRDATGPMYLTVGGGSGSCSGFVNVTRLDGNALHKFDSACFRHCGNFRLIQQQSPKRK
ncbi:uncharacterized protein LOC101847424 [Aplysia californica]|uniref:Uncharacterized protein LOC101847424 n=1 Tax=Aplysia californica TaxID=6500 RepID=A0ABM1VTV4_APLCA|nr:uncharacterized protein LOC101847424 [Aplysia californica]